MSALACVSGFPRLLRGKRSPKGCPRGREGNREALTFSTQWRVEAIFGDLADPDVNAEFILAKERIEWKIIGPRNTCYPHLGNKRGMHYITLVSPVQLYPNLKLTYLLTLLQLPLIEVGNAVRAYCYSIASYPWTLKLTAHWIRDRYLASCLAHSMCELIDVA